MERRRATRREPSADEPLSRVRFRTGREVAVVNVSNTGLLVEGVARLLPGTHVDVHVVTREGRVLVRSRVTRAWVWALEADLVRYRGALAFDRIVDTTAIGYVIPSVLVAAADASGSGYPSFIDDQALAFEDRLTA
jgi:hypothetical protein